MRKLIMGLVAGLGVVGLIAVASAHMGNGDRAAMRGYGPGSGWTGGMGPGWMHGSSGNGSGMMGQGWNGGTGMGPGWMHGSSGNSSGMMGQGWMAGTGMGPDWMHGSDYRNNLVDKPSAPNSSTKLPPQKRDSNSGSER